MKHFNTTHGMYGTTEYVIWRNMKQQVTGLDRVIAERILQPGKPIDHPYYQFSAEDVNPFEPARIVVP